MYETYAEDIRDAQLLLFLLVTDDQFNFLLVGDRFKNWCI